MIMKAEFCMFYLFECFLLQVHRHRFSWCWIWSRIKPVIYICITEDKLNQFSISMLQLRRFACSLLSSRVLLISSTFSRDGVIIDNCWAFQSPGEIDAYEVMITICPHNVCHGFRKRGDKSLLYPGILQKQYKFIFTSLRLLSHGVCGRVVLIKHSLWRGCI